MAVLDVAADLREKWLFDIWRMGRDAIEGSGAGWIVPADQWDPGEAAALVNVLYDGGIVIERAEEAFEIDGETYGEGSYIIPGAQAFRAYAEDLLEAQGLSGPPAHPGRAARSSLRPRGLDAAHADGSAGDAGRGGARGSPPHRWMVVSGRRPVRSPPGVPSATRSRTVRTPRSSPRTGCSPPGPKWPGQRRASRTAGRSTPAGTLVVRRTDPADAAVEGIASELGLDVGGLSRAPDVELLPLEPVRVGLYKSYVASMDEGWTRWLLENYEYDLTNLSDDDVRTGDLSPAGRDRPAAPVHPGDSPGTRPRHHARRVHRRYRTGRVPGAEPFR